MGMFGNRPTKQTMKIIAIVISFACFSLGRSQLRNPAQAPLRSIRHYAPHPGQVRRLNYFERKHESEARAEEPRRKRNPGPIADPLPPPRHKLKQPTETGRRRNVR